MADEYVDLVCKLFDILGSRRGGDGSRNRAPMQIIRKVRPINFEGKYFKCRGPLNTVRSPQGKPVFVQAGGSPRGRAFAAKHADFDHRDRERHRGHEAATATMCGGHAVSFGRDPDDDQGAVPGVSDPGGDR